MANYRKRNGKWNARVRIKNEKPAGLEELNPKHPKWAGAMKALKDGSVTIEQIKRAYTLPDAYEKLLKL